MTTPYTTGQISLVNGEALVTGIGTSWATSLIVGGTIYVEVDGGNPLPIEEVGGDIEITAAIAWTGPTGTYNYALVRDTAYGQQTVANAQALADYIQRLNNTTLSAVAGVNAIADTLLLFTGPDTATTIPLAGLINGADYDVQVNNLAGRAVYDSSAANFRVLVSDIGDGRSAIYSKNTNTAGDWSAAAVLTGRDGTDGDDGAPGTPGAPGSPGPYTTINAGTVTTLAPGSQATATFVPVSSGVVRLDLGLPAGQNGTGAGTVTSVAVSVPTGLQVGGSPIISNGTIAITYQSGYQGFTSAQAAIIAGLGNAASRNVGTTAGTVAAGDDARFSQGGSSQNEAILALEISDLKGSRLGMKGGVADAFDDETGVDVKTNAVYDATNDWYSPSSADTSTLALLHFDGANGSTSIVDERAIRTWTLSGSASISTTQSKFGGASLSLSGGYVSAPAASDLNFGTGDFTIEFWLRPNSVSTNAILVDMRSPANAPVIYITGSAVTYYSSSNRISSTTLATVNTWCHVALVRASGVTKLYINGNKEGVDYTDTTNYTSSGIRLGLGSDNTSAYSGFLDEVRISNSARYTSNFTPQVTAFKLLAGNMTLRSIAYAAAAVPTTGRLAVQLVETDTVTINTDLIARVSRDGGTTWATASLTLSQSLIGPKIYEATGINLSSLGSGTSMKWEVATANNKNVAVSGVVAQWS